MWQYIVTFLGSLIVALISVWFSHWMSARIGYKKALKDLRVEVLTNIKVSGYICEWVDRNVRALKEGERTVFSCPLLQDPSWITIKGTLALNDRGIVASIDDAYLFINVINRNICNIEELKWSIVGVLPNTGENVELMLSYTREVVKESLLPELIKAKNLLDKRLKIVEVGK